MQEILQSNSDLLVVAIMILLLLLTGTTVTIVSGHGRLIEPPSRSTMWRYGFSNPPNFNDHEIYCGGFTRQWRTNGGKCGVCGDPWDQPQVSANTECSAGLFESEWLSNLQLKKEKRICDLFGIKQNFNSHLLVLFR